MKCRGGSPPSQKNWAHGVVSGCGGKLRVISLQEPASSSLVMHFWWVPAMELSWRATSRQNAWQSWPCRLRRQNDIFLASTKGCQSDFSVIPMGAPILRGRSAHSAIPTSAPTSGVTTPLDTGITILLTTGNTAVTASSSCGSGRSPDRLKMKNPATPAVKRKRIGANDPHSFASA